MKERILKFMEKENMTAAEFADAIGVQRSSVSHVLNGRNNPSSSFLQKIVGRFPNIDPRWLLLGEGNEPKPLERSLFEPSPEERNSYSEEKTEQQDSRQSGVNESLSDNLFQMIESEAPASYNTPPEKTKQRRISRIVIFYDDKTFSEYFPGE